MNDQERDDLLTRLNWRMEHGEIRDARHQLMTPVAKFAQAIMHGDEEHRKWLQEAADAFCNGEPLPEVNGKGRADALQEKLTATEAKLAKCEKSKRPFSPELSNQVIERQVKRIQELEQEVIALRFPPPANAPVIVNDTDPHAKHWFAGNDDNCCKACTLPRSATCHFQ